MSFRVRWRTCRTPGCGHPIEWHEHYRPGRDCSAGCGCERPRRGGRRDEDADAARYAREWAHNAAHHPELFPTPEETTAIGTAIIAGLADGMSQPVSPRWPSRWRRLQALLDGPDVPPVDPDLGTIGERDDLVIATEQGTGEAPPVARRTGIARGDLVEEAVDDQSHPPSIEQTIERNH